MGGRPTASQRCAHEANTSLPICNLDATSVTFCIVTRPLATINAEYKDAVMFSISAVKSVNVEMGTRMRGAVTPTPNTPSSTPKLLLVTISDTLKSKHSIFQQRKQTAEAFLLYKHQKREMMSLSPYIVAR